MLANGEKTVFDIITEMAEDMCKNYCRFPLVYKPEYFNDKDYMDRLLEEKCKDCPMRRLM